MPSIRWIGWLGGVLLIAGFAAGDSITVRGTTYKNVFIRKGETRYLVQIPEQGASFSVPIEQVPENDVTISEDESERQALLKQWRTSFEKRRQADPNASLVADAPIKATQPPAVPLNGAPVPAKEVTPKRSAETAPRMDAGDLANGIRAREAEVGSNGVRKLVLKGSRLKDPGRDQRIMQQFIERQQALEQEAMMAEAQRNAELYPNENAAQEPPGPRSMNNYDMGMNGQAPMPQIPYAPQAAQPVPGQPYDDQPALGPLDMNQTPQYPTQQQADTPQDNTAGNAAPSGDTGTAPATTDIDQSKSKSTASPRVVTSPNTVALTKPPTTTKLESTRAAKVPMPKAQSKPDDASDGTSK